MTVRREDLMAAAAAGLLPASHVDTMLIFLRQRDAVQQRERQHAAKAHANPGVRGSQVLLFLLAVVALGAAVVAVLLQAGLVFDPAHVLRSDPDAGRLCTYLVLVVLLSIGLADRVERRRQGAAARILTVAWLGLALMSAFALYQTGMLKLPF